MRNTSAGRAWMVPCTRIPVAAGTRSPARRWASARSTKHSPAKKLWRTNGTTRSTRGLSWGERTRAGSTTNPRDWAYSTKAWLSRGSVASARSTMAFRLSGIAVANTPW